MTFPAAISPATAMVMPGADAFALGCGGYGTPDGVSNDCVFVKCLGHFRMRDVLRQMFPNGGPVLPSGIARTCLSVDLTPWTRAANVAPGDVTWSAVVYGDVSGFQSVLERVVAALGRAAVWLVPSLARHEEPGGAVSPTPAWFVPLVVVLGVLLLVVCAVDVFLLVVIVRRRRARAAERAAHRLSNAASAPFGAEDAVAPGIKPEGPTEPTTTAATSAAVSPPEVALVATVSQRPSVVASATRTPAAHCPDNEDAPATRVSSPRAAVEPSVEPSAEPSVEPSVAAETAPDGDVVAAGDVAMHVSVSQSGSLVASTGSPSTPATSVDDVVAFDEPLAASGDA